MIKCEKFFKAIWRRKNRDNPTSLLDWSACVNFKPKTGPPAPVFKV